MKKTNEIVKEFQVIMLLIYQIMFPYRNTLTILNQDGMVYHHKPGSNSNIPIHFSQVGFKKSESFAIKDNNRALLINSIMLLDNHVEHITYDELLKYVPKINNARESKIL